MKLTLVVTYAIAAFLLCHKGLAQFQDSTVQSQANLKDSTLQMWLMDDHYDTCHQSVISDFQRFQTIYPLYREGMTYAFLGNRGSPSFPLIDSRLNRSPKIRFWFLQPYKPYIHHDRSRKYYNTLTPFTNVSYTSNFGSKEKLNQSIHVLHTQNVNQSVNIGLDFDLLSAKGQYPEQENKIGSLSLFTSYFNPRYDIHGNVNINKVQADKNGGIDPQNFLSSEKDTKTYLNVLTDVHSVIRNRSINMVQKFHFGKVDNRLDSSNVSIPLDSTNQIDSTGTLPDSGEKTSQADSVVDSTSIAGNFSKTASLVHEFAIQDNYRTYADNNLTENASFYNTIYDTTDPFITKDSAFFSSIHNEIRLKIHEDTSRFWGLGGYLGVKHDFTKYAYKQTFPDTGKTYKVNEQNLSDIYLTGGLNQRKTYLRWYIKGSYCLSGYRQGDKSLSTHIDLDLGSNQFLSIMGQYQEKTPDYFLQDYASNHIRWRNNFSAEQKGRTELMYKHRDFQLEAGNRLSVYSDLIYFDNSYNPRQSANGTRVYSGFLRKNIEFWKIFMNNRVTYSHVTNRDVLRLPEWNVYNSTYFSHTFHFQSTGGRLEMQSGFNFYYFSEYRGYGYMPAINRFYIQNEHQMGGYLYTDFFLNVRIKRLRIAFTINHLNAGMAGKDYVNVWHYPMPPRVMQIGLSWNFYD